MGKEVIKKEDKNYIMYWGKYSLNKTTKASLNASIYHLLRDIDPRIIFDQSIRGAMFELYREMCSYIRNITHE